MGLGVLGIEPRLALSETSALSLLRSLYFTVASLGLVFGTPPGPLNIARCGQKQVKGCWHLSLSSSAFFSDEMLPGVLLISY